MPQKLNHNLKTASLIQGTNQPIDWFYLSIVDILAKYYSLQAEISEHVRSINEKVHRP